MTGTLILLAGVLGASAGPITPPWGFVGHEMAARAAAGALPDQMPAFFRSAGDQLVYLDPEPDRWRSRELQAMDQALSYDHYMDLENVPEGALDAPDRFAFLKVLYDAGLEKPERDAGFVTYRALELYQRIVTEWRLWRNETDPTRRSWIEQRIINDAGVMGHYVTDASQPHHTTIHFNGWDAGTPNPNGYNTDNTFHSRFERFFVEAHVTQVDVKRFTRVGPPPSVVGKARDAILAHFMESHGEVDTLYRLDRDIGFDPAGATESTTRDFAAERLAAGADMLAVLWWSAWLESGTSPGHPAP